MHSVSITIPVYNEVLVLADTVSKLIADLADSGLDYEVILAENGSTDETAQIAEQLAARFPRVRALHLTAPDYGRALREGYLASTRDNLANFSIDFVDLAFLQTALSRLGSLDVVLGSKYLAQDLDRRPALRRLAGRLLSALVRFMFGIPFADTHGLLVLRREKTQNLVRACRAGNEILDTELIVRAYRTGLAIGELPIQVEETRPSKLGAARRALRMLAHFARLRVQLWQEGIR